MKKKSLLSFALVLTLLAGCSQSASPSSSGSQSSSAASTSGASSSASSSADTVPTDGMPLVTEPLTLKVWGHESVDNDYYTNVTTTEYEKMTGVHIEWDLFSSSMDVNQAFNLLVASGEYPDIMATGFSTEQIKMCIEGNVLLPLNDLIEQYGTNYKNVLEEQPQYRDMLTANDGNIYTFMYTDTGVHKDSEYKMWVYTEWLDKLGLKEPTTPEEFKQMLIAFRDNDPNGNGQADELPLTGFYKGRQSDPICYLMNPFQLYNDNYFYITDDKKVEFIANTDGWRDGLRYLHDLYKDGLILEETYVQDKTQFQALLNRPKGETIVGVFPFWFQGDAIDSKVLDWTDYQAIAPLKGPTGLQQTAARKGGDFRLDVGITTQCKNPEVAFRWLDWMLSEEGLYFGHYGVEGITYEWVDQPSFSGADRSIKLYKTDKPQVWNSGFFPRYDKAEARYATSFDEAQKNIDNTYVLYSAAKIYEPYYVWHNVPTVVWCTDDNVSVALSDYQTLFNDVIGSNYTAFVMGTQDINDDAQWQAYLDSLNSLGLEDYINTLTKYYIG